MQFLSIGVNEFAEDMADYVSNGLQQLNYTDIDCHVDKVIDGESTSIVLSINEEGFDNDKLLGPSNGLIPNVSNILADYIIKKYEEKLIGRIVASSYCYFNAVEREEILFKALKNIRNEDKNILNSLFQIRRRNIIVKKLLEYFDSSTNIILDGFVNFRLKDYVKELEEIVDKAVDEFLMDREYREFIRLLRYFVDIQEPKFDTIHVVVNFKNRYSLLDGNKKEITNECIQEFINEISEGEINYDDLLVSSLITLAPRKIVLHCTNQFRNKELLETIKNVFSPKVFICTGCDMCSVNMVKHESEK